MILTCEKCDTSFSFNEDLIQSSGSKVRCSKCRHIFVVLPPTPVEETEAAALSEQSPSPQNSVPDAASLDDLDLDAIEKSLDLDSDLAPEEETPPAREDLGSGLDLDFEEDDTKASADAVEAELESTDELDFDLDLDFDAPSDESVVGTDITSEATETMDFSLDLDLDDETSGAAESDSDPATEDLAFDLDLGLDETSEAENAFSNNSDTTDDIDFQLDLDLDDSETEPSDSENAVGGLDFDQGEKSVVADSGVEFDETQELDLSDVDSLLDLGHEDVEESVSDEATEGLDIDLDFGQETDTLIDSEEEVAEAGSAGEDLEFELDLDSDELPDSATDNATDVESTEELDLANLEEMIESEDDTEQQAVEDSTVDELNFEIELDDDTAEEQAVAATAEETEITDDFDLTGLDDLLELDDGATSPDEPSAAQPVMESVESGSGAEDSSGEDEVVLDDMFDLEMDELDPIEDTAEAGEEFELELEDHLKSNTEAEINETVEEQDEDEFDLSDLDDMLEIEDSPKVDASVDEDEEFDLDLDLDDVAVADDAGEAGLDFDVEEEELADSKVAEAAAVASTAVAATDSDGFDMGALSATEDDVVVEEEDAPEVVGESDVTKPAKAKKKRVGGLMKTLLVLVLLVGGGYGAIVAAQYFGIDIPYLDKVKDLNIPYVSDLLGPKQQDAGNLKITIIEKDVDGRFVSDTKQGMLYVVTGKVKNDYDHPRSFIQITGKLYSKGRKLQLEKTVYAGNVLSDAELSGMDQAGINKKLGNRMGQKRSNLSLKTGAQLPFMIVFSNLPKDPDEYTVEVAGSVKAKK